MILSCERCDARYAVDIGQLGGSGRKVRCTSCGYTWFQAPEASTSTGEGMIAPEFLVSSTDSARAPGASSGPSAESEAPVLRRFGATAPPRKVEEKRHSAWRQDAFKLAAVILPTALLAAALFGFRSDLVEIWPPVARLYSAIGALPPEIAPGLAIRSVRMQEHMEDGHRTVIVEGEVANTGTEPHKVPTLLHATLAQGDATMARWSFAAGPTELAPGEAAPFHTQLADAPEGAQSVSVSLWR